MAKREKEIEIQREEERLELERIRAMPEEQRLKEDLERVKREREKPKTQGMFLQKYWHKGAFHQVDRPFVYSQYARIDTAVFSIG